MIYGKNSWKGLILLLYVVITLCAAIGCVIAPQGFFNVVAALLLISNGVVVWDIYKTLNQDA